MYKQPFSFPPARLLEDLDETRLTGGKRRRKRREKKEKNMCKVKKAEEKERETEENGVTGVV